MALIFFNQQVSGQENTQSTTALTAFPAIIEVAGERGKMTSHKISITNDTSVTLPVSSEAREITIDDEILPAAQRERFDASQWVNIKDKDFILPANGKKDLFITVQIPEDALPGGHYTTISVRGLSIEEFADETKTLIVPEINIPVFIGVPGEIIESLRFTDTEPFPKILTKESFMFTYEIENTGNTHNLIAPIITIKEDGQEVFTHKNEPRVILPGVKKQFTTEISLPKRGLYKGTVSVSFGTPPQEISTKPEDIYYILSPIKIFGLLVVVFGGAYLIERRENLLPALNELFKNS